MNDIIIQAPIEAHSKRWNRFTQTALVCLEQNSLSGYREVSSRSTAMAFYDARGFLLGFPRKHSNTSHIRKSYSGRCRAHLAASIERVSSQTNKNCLCKSISPFTMGLSGSPYDYVIDVALIVTLHVSLITSCQPPLVQVQVRPKILSTSWNDRHDVEVWKNYSCHTVLLLSILWLLLYTPYRKIRLKTGNFCLSSLQPTSLCVMVMHTNLLSPLTLPIPRVRPAVQWAH